MDALLDPTAQGSRTPSVPPLARPHGANERSASIPLTQHQIRGRSPASISSGETINGQRVRDRHDPRGHHAPTVDRPVSRASLDEVSLEENVSGTTVSRSRSSTAISNNSTGPVGRPTMTAPNALTKTPSMTLDALPRHTPSDGRHSPVPTPTPAKKLASPFSWLSRISSKETPPAPVTTSGPAPNKQPAGATSTRPPPSGHSELMLDRLENGHPAPAGEPTADRGRRPRSNTLRDRFKLQRMKEQAGIDSLGGPNGDAPSSLDPASTSTDPQDRNGSAEPGGRRDPSGALPLASARVDPNLAPGTAAGISTGPPLTKDAAAQIDWDLWQSLVYEGPAIVAQKSSEELSQAIAGGIPSAIRGVVWQVLANSQDAELEKDFKELANWSSDSINRKRLPSERSGSITTDASTGDAASDRDASGAPGQDRAVDGEVAETVTDVGPSTSSTHRDRSLSSPDAEKGDPTSCSQSNSMPSAEPDPSPNDAVALQKLEKTIKRDLGARTSFSKYAASAGLQDSLFRVCKAYALHDKGVGYAQGMNFLAMPLLFNVSDCPLVVFL